MTEPNDTDALPLELSTILGSDVPTDPTRQIFVNRNLNMAKIEFIGFDMDYTLAPYHQHAMDSLSIQATVANLIAKKGYPAEIRDAHLDHDFIIRGLMVDKELGNIFKMDSHKHVGRCYHGYEPLPKDARRQTYGAKTVRQSEDDRFHWVDTLFSLPEATLLAGIIQHYEHGDPARALPWTYRELFDDIRHSIDLAHQDDSLKSVIVPNLPTYIDRDPDLAATLHKLRSAGKKLFLLTNSEWWYTDAVMRFLLDGALPFYKSWRHYFDLVIVSARKPGFFTDEAPFIELDADGGEVGEAGTLEWGRVYQGGNIKALSRLFESRGDDVLYVGDHIYGDILRSKKTSAWRTCLVIQEMEDMLRITREERERLRRVEKLEEAAIRLDHDINYLLTLLKSLARVQENGDAFTSLEARVMGSTAERTYADLEAKRTALKRTLDELESTDEALDLRFNPYWGRLFRESNERSLFGDQVEDYACVYTSRVSNLLAYSPVQYFRAARDVLPHERDY